MRIHWTLVLVHLAILQLQHIVHRVTGDLAEQRVLVLQLGRLAQREEELRRIVVPTGVRHGDQTTSDEAETGVELIFEGAAVYGLAASAVAARVATFDKESID